MRTVSPVEPSIQVGAGAGQPIEPTFEDITLAAFDDNLAEFQTLLAEKPEALFETDDLGSTILHNALTAAVEQRGDKVLNAILETQDNQLKKLMMPNRNGDNPLHLALAANRLDLAKRIISPMPYEMRIEFLTQKNGEDRTPLDTFETAEQFLNGCRELRPGGSIITLALQTYRNDVPELMRLDPAWWPESRHLDRAIRYNNPTALAAFLEQTKTIVRHPTQDLLWHFKAAVTANNLAMIDCLLQCAGDPFEFMDAASDGRNPLQEAVCTSVEMCQLIIRRLAAASRHKLQSKRLLALVSSTLKSLHEERAIPGALALLQAVATNTATMEMLQEPPSESE